MDTAYRGYLIRRNIVGDWWVEKGGFLIGWAKDESHARRIVDAVHGD